MKRSILLAACLLLPLGGLAADAAQYVGWGNQMLAAKKYEDAVKYFGAALRADPKNAAAYKGTGYAYVYLGDKAKALQYLKYAVQLNPSDTQLSQYVGTLGGAAPSGPAAAETAYGYGMKYMESKQYAYAAYYFKQAGDADPTLAKAFKGLGDAYDAQGSKDKAVAAWDKAAALDPTLAKATPPPSAGTAKAQAGFNPWVMGGTVAALSAVMLFLF
jgi:tetratricopeptide (TPR) repeat protein